MKAIIIEDEKLSAEHLANLIRKTDNGITITGVYDSVKSVVNEFKNGITADIIFADVQLADGLSFEIFSKISTTTPIIFTTAYNEYAIRAFKLNSVDYLLKPIDINELKAAIDKFKTLNKNNRQVVIENVQNAIQDMGKPYKSRFMVKIGDTINSIKAESISCFIFEDGEVLITLDNGKRYIINYTLDQLEGLISPNEFFRINRKVIVNITTIAKVTTYFNSRLKVQSAFLSEDDAIVSRERVNDFKGWLDK